MRQKDKNNSDYEAFLRGKIKMAEPLGVACEPKQLNKKLKQHQSAIAQWMVTGGRRACFASFGLGKSVIQLETLRLILESHGGRALLVIPLGVRQEFKRDAVNILGWKEPPFFIRKIEQASNTGIYMTNYETIRDEKLDPCEFCAISLDEASVLRGFGGSKTFRAFMRLCTGDGGPTGNHRQDGKSVKYRFVATATPSPNEYIELLAYAEFLGIMDVSQAKTRFFKRDSTKADKLTLHAHKEPEFWMWVASWAIFVQRPSDLGYSDKGYVMPRMSVIWHEVATDHHNAGFDKQGQRKMFVDAAIGVQDSAAEKRNSLPSRIRKLMEIRALAPKDHRIIWHDLNDERDDIHKAIPSVISITGGGGEKEIQEREKRIIEFSDGKFQELSTKPKIAGSGCNFQRHCHWEIFLGIGFKFNDFIQAIHRVLRFGQDKEVRIDIIYTEAERTVKKQLERKWQQHNKLVEQMTKLIKEFGLSSAAMAKTLTRKLGVDRIEIIGENYRLINHDSCVETKRMEDNSAGLILTSIPFSTQYEYSPNYADFGHSEGNEEFFGQMDFLTPQLLRILQPGRLCAIHVKDRVVPGGMTGLGFQTVYPFHCRTIEHFTKHGFAYMGMKTIVTDVVRENNQTYRLGWTEQCKDGTKMGVGMPEYLLIFRKPPTDASNGYADNPVVKSKKQYLLAKWQVDAHGFSRSSGNRKLTPKEISELEHQAIFKVFREKSLTEIYNFEHHVKIGEEIGKKGKLPTDFMLLQPQSWHDDVWTEITRMQTLNAAQWSHGKEMHLCPMQFDIARRAIEQWSNKGDVVFDPFSGLGTVPMIAVEMRRKGLGIELNHAYFLDSADYCKCASDKVATPDLFDLDACDNEVTQPKKLAKR